MAQELYVVDAFTERPFAGNPAAVCPLPHWIESRWMQAIAAENALSETAFFVRRAGGEADLRWFTPTTEVDLCGHATLASAYVWMRFLEPARDAVRFHTRSGLLEVARDGARLAMELPRDAPEPFEPPTELARALGVPVVAWLRGRFPIAVLESEERVRALRPDFTRVSELSITAPGRDCDFVSRFFAPGLGIPEDPVTGAAHCSLVPYWSQRLGRRVLTARQVSPRGGELEVEDRERSIVLRGACALYARGAIELDLEPAGTGAWTT